MQKSKKIEQFFKEHSSHDDFWDALREEKLMIPDHEWWSEGDHYDEFEAGYDFALSADGEPVYTYTTEDGDNVFYWIGNENEIVDKLKRGWENWQKRTNDDVRWDKRQKLLAKKNALELELQEIQQKLATKKRPKKKAKKKKAKTRSPSGWGNAEHRR